MAKTFTSRGAVIREPRKEGKRRGEIRGGGLFLLALLVKGEKKRGLNKNPFPGRVGVPSD